MSEAERARKKEILRKIIETLPPETKATITELKIEWILDAIEVVERYGPLIQTIRKAPCPVTPIFTEEGGKHDT